MDRCGVVSEAVEDDPAVAEPVRPDDRLVFVVGAASSGGQDIDLAHVHAAVDLIVECDGGAESSDDRMVGDDGRFDWSIGRVARHAPVPRCAEHVAPQRPVVEADGSGVECDETAAIRNEIGERRGDLGWCLVRVVGAPGFIGRVEHAPPQPVDDERVESLRPEQLGGAGRVIGELDGVVAGSHDLDEGGPDGVEVVGVRRPTRQDEHATHVVASDRS